MVKDKLGKTVYTVNAKTNTVDTWTSVGLLPTKDGLLIQLVNGKKTCFLPERCVFTSEAKARAVSKQ